MIRRPQSTSGASASTGTSVTTSKMFAWSRAIPADAPDVFTEGCVESFDRARLSDWGRRATAAHHARLEKRRCGLDRLEHPASMNAAAPITSATSASRRPRTHAARQVAGELTFMNSFYYLGHFSKFIRPGAKRITASSSSDELPAPRSSIPTRHRRRRRRNQSEKPHRAELPARKGGLTSPAHSILTAIVKKRRLTGPEPPAGNPPVHRQCVSETRVFHPVFMRFSSRRTMEIVEAAP